MRPFMSGQAGFVVAASFLLFTGCRARPGTGNGEGFAHPGGMHTLAQIEETQAHLQQEPWASAFAQLMAEAEAALAPTPKPVKVFAVPFYYRNPDKGQAAKKPLNDDALRAYALALAYRLSSESDPRHAEAATAILGAWARTNKKIAGLDGPLVMCYAGVPLLFAADLLRDYGGWDSKSQAAFRVWVRDVFWPNAQRVKRRANNHGDWGTFASIVASHYLDDRETVLSDVERIKRRIDETIAENGELPLENLRTNSGMWYTYFALAPMTGACQVAFNSTGTDLFRYRSPRGRTIQQALDKYFEYCLDPETWPYRLKAGARGRVQRIFHPCADEVELPSPDGMPGNLYEAMICVYGNERWDEWVGPHRPLHGYRAWIYPTLLGAGPLSSG